MKLAWNVFVVVHLLALVGIIGWLVASDRLDRVRARQIVDTFRTTIAEEKAQAALATQEQQRQQQIQADLVRLQEVAHGPVTVADRLAADAEADEVAAQKIDWLRRATADLTAKLESDKQQLIRQKSELDQARDAFTKAAQSRVEQQQQQDFQLAVRMYEQLKPVQAKAMFKELIVRGQEEQVLDYLAAMQLRKAAAVLREFKDGEDVTMAASLIQGLRERGIESPGPSARQPQLVEGST